MRLKNFRVLSALGTLLAGQTAAALAQAGAQI